MSSDLSSASPSTLQRLTGACAALCGALTAVFWVLHPVAADPKAPHDAAYWEAVLSPRFMAVNGTFVLILIACLFGTVGAFMTWRKELGTGGAVGFALGFTGTALFVAAGVFTAFVVPVIAAEPAARGLLSPTGPLFAGPLSGVFAGGGLSFAAGFVTLGVQLFRRTSARWAGLLLVVSSPILGLSPLMPLAARATGSLVFGIAFMWLGLQLWRGAPASISTGRDASHAAV